ncbi:hypothetical protein PHYSODRAFT_293929 [Phytophthora sojae]|uniref:Uncharacterized protein n=1 Tax=Phytophthora sojae (strain P6497) TaxID=1094619 RepID=G4YG18_PHYSP|nr:hypothetical protein PHYSODRAFT_293929 [Phytophthora sojae]EGZ28361.1 hypothetical protein PHYSODRAFT_293929 [Phytophthora sojae]|eukprot:XP_009515636.1 hypothetical protein PHYSODRAFT_293929 [Phytophthora sojae]
MVFSSGRISRVNAEACLLVFVTAPAESELVLSVGKLVLQGLKRRPPVPPSGKALLDAAEEASCTANWGQALVSFLLFACVFSSPHGFRAVPNRDREPKLGL